MLRFGCYTLLKWRALRSYNVSKTFANVVKLDFQEFHVDKNIVIMQKIQSIIIGSVGLCVVRGAITCNYKQKYLYYTSPMVQLIYNYKSGRIKGVYFGRKVNCLYLEMKFD